VARVTTRTLPTGGIDLDGTVATLALLPGDPTIVVHRGRLARATWTPEGPGTLVAVWDDQAAEVQVHGDGARWLSERAPALLGLTDDVSGFAPTTQPLRDLWRRHAAVRIPRTHSLWHDLAWFVVQQRVTREDAAAQWRRLVEDLGTPAPGAPDLRVPPAPATVARLPYHAFHRYGIERRRADHLCAAARALRRLEPLVDEPVEAALPRLRAVPGVGAWTAACLAATTWGDRDAVIVGDAGIPALVTWALAREERGDDARMLELLEPHRPHRYRVLRLIMGSGLRPPRRAPKARRTDIRRW
jgi:3-methyladenine DNA glycosylase/8-oxoguanine DNA glycosylase